MPAGTRRFVRTDITPDDFRQVAWTLVNRHGAKALGYAEMAVDELEEKGEMESGQLGWRFAVIFQLFPEMRIKFPRPPGRAIWPCRLFQ